VAKPVVDGIEKELGSSARVVRLSVTDDVSAQLAARYGVRSVPTFVLLDGSGDVVLAQAGIPKKADIIDAVAGLPGS
jgi:thioredoxin-related protein